MVKDYTFENGEASGPPATNGAKGEVRVGTAACEQIEDGNRGLSGILLRVKSRAAIAVPLEAAAATLGGAGTAGKRSVGFYAPVDPSSEERWITPTPEIRLVLNIGASRSTDLLFVFAGNGSKGDLLRIAGVDIPIDAGPPPFTIETHRAWTLKDPSFVNPKKRKVDALGHAVDVDGPCHADIKWSVNGENVTLAEGSIVGGPGENIADFQLNMLCPGARHTWVGRSMRVFDTFWSIMSSTSNPLQFRVVKSGYQYVKGRGVLKFNNGRIIRFPGSKR